MNRYDRIVTQLPLDNLWNDVEPVDARKGNKLDDAAIKDLLRNGPAQFVIADCGFPLRWIDLEDCFELWKTEIQSHLYNPSMLLVEDYPSEYFYFASEWFLPTGERAIVLEKHH